MGVSARGNFEALCRVLVFLELDSRLSVSVSLRSIVGDLVLETCLDLVTSTTLGARMLFGGFTKGPCFFGILVLGAVSVDNWLFLRSIWEFFVEGG